MEQTTLVDKYCDAFWDKFDLVAGCVDVHRSELKEFMGMIENRSKVQQKYSESLVQLYSQKYENRASLVGQLIKAYLTEVKKRAQQTRIFSNFLMTDVSNKIRELLDGTNNEYKRITSLGRSGDKELDRLKELVARNRAKHQKKRKELEQAELLDFVMSTSKEYGPNRKDLQKQKIRDKKVELKEINNELNKNIQEYNTFSKTYEETMRNVMVKYYELEHQRIKIVVDSVLKIQLTEMSSLKNILFEIEEKSRFLHQIDTLKQMKCILKNNLEKRTGRADTIYFEKQHNFMSSTFARINSKQLEQVLSYGKQHKQILEKFFKNEQISDQEEQTKKVVNIAKIFCRAWHGQSTQTDLTELKSVMDNVFMRKDFVLCMQQLRLLGRFQISQGCLESIVRAVNIVLDSCLTHKDGYAGKQIMVLVFTYFVLVKNDDQEPEQQQTKQPQPAKEVEQKPQQLTKQPEVKEQTTESTEQIVKPTQQASENPDLKDQKIENCSAAETKTIEVSEPKKKNVTKIFLQHYVKTHPIWSEKDFWQSSFVESIYEECRQFKNKPELVVRGPGGFEHEQNLVFNQLAYYVHNMVLFSIPQKDVRLFANKFIKMYSLDESRTTYIFSNIENSLKQEQAEKTKNEHPQKQSPTSATTTSKSPLTKPPANLQPTQQDTSPIREAPIQSRLMSSIRKMFE